MVASYAVVRPILAALTVIPLIPATWRAALSIFITTLDGVSDSFKAGKDLAVGDGGSTLIFRSPPSRVDQSELVIPIEYPKNPDSLAPTRRKRRELLRAARRTGSFAPEQVPDRHHQRWTASKGVTDDPGGVGANLLNSESSRVAVYHAFAVTYASLGVRSPACKPTSYLSFRPKNVEVFQTEGRITYRCVTPIDEVGVCPRYGSTVLIGRESHGRGPSICEPRVSVSTNERIS
jgi:hypothetical protein